MDQSSKSTNIADYRLDLIKAMGFASSCIDQIERGDAIFLEEFRLLLFAFQLLLEPLHALGNPTLESGLLSLRLAFEDPFTCDSAHVALCNRLRNLIGELQSFLRIERTLEANLDLNSGRSARSIEAGRMILRTLEAKTKPAA